MNLPTCIDVYLDEPFRQKLNHGASQIISRIHMTDFRVKNTLGLTFVQPKTYHGPAIVKDKITLEDFIVNASGKGAGANSIPGINYSCVKEFTDIFEQQYDNLLAMGILGEDSQKLEKYLDQFVSQGEYNHKEDQPFSKLLLTNLLDLTIIKPIVESCCGYDLITEEDLTDMERSLKLVFAIVDLVTLATGLYGFTLAAETIGAKEAVAYFARLALVELAADVSAITVATIGEYCEWPAGLTILLSLGAGLTVGQVGNHLIFKQNGIEIFRKEVSESGEFFENNGVLLDDLMSPEEATKYIAYKEGKFYEEFSERASAAGLNDTQIAEAFEAMKAGDYTKMASYFDTSSPVNGAVFWSGNKEGAAAYASNIGGTIMEQTSGGQVFDNWRGLQGMYPEWDTGTALDQKPIWEALSSQYANGAEGIATYAHPSGYEGKVWLNIEKLILQENDIFIVEVIIDAK